MNPNMYVDQTAQMAQNIHAEEERMGQMYNDTYKQRMLEGRPKHSMLSFATIALGLVSFLVQLGSLCMANWRANWIGVMGYPMSRSWGLFMIKGAKGSMVYSEQARIVCEVFGKMHLGGFCVSPLCVWYKVKCFTYWDMWTYLTGFGVGFVIVLLFHGACVFWTVRLTPSTLQMASVWWCIVAAGHLSLLAGYYFMSEDFFDSMNIYSFYPTPYLGFGFFFSCFSSLCVCANVAMGCQLASIWPVPDTEFDDDEDDEEED